MLLTLFEIEIIQLPEHHPLQEGLKPLSAEVQQDDLFTSRAPSITRRIETL